MLIESLFLGDIENIEINEGDPFTIKATASDPDGDKLRFSYSGWVNQDSYTTIYGDAGEHNVKVTVSDGWLEDSKELKIIVKKKNRAPVFEEIGGYSVNEGELLRMRLNAYDPDGDKIIFSAENLTNASIKDNLFEWMPSYSVAAKDSKEIKIKFTASDGVEVVTRDAIVTVNHVNLVPEIVESSPGKNTVIKRNEPVTFKINAEDPDGDALSYKWDFGFFEKYDNIGNTIKRVFSTAGNKKVEVTVSDGKKEIVYEWDIKVI